LEIEISAETVDSDKELQDSLQVDVFVIEIKSRILAEFDNRKHDLTLEELKAVSKEIEVAMALRRKLSVLIKKYYNKDHKSSLFSEITDPSANTEPGSFTDFLTDLLKDEDCTTCDSETCPEHKDTEFPKTDIDPNIRFKTG